MIEYQGEKFRQFIENKRIRKVDAAKMLGLSRSGLYAYFNSNNLGRESVQKICTAFSVNEEEVFGESDASTKNASNASLIGALEPQSDVDGNTKFTEISPGRYRMKVDLVPFYARAGYLAGFGDHPYVEELPKHEVTVTKYHKGKYMAFDVAGDSMNDGSINSIPDKSIITGRVVERDLWQPKLHTHNHDYWIFIHKYEGILVKRVKSQELNTGELVLSSLNPDKEEYPDQTINLIDVHQILNVVKIEREL